MTASTIDEDIRYGTLSTYCCCCDSFPLRSNLAYRTGSKVSPNCRSRCNSWAQSVHVAVGTARLFAGVVVFLVVVAAVAEERATVAAGGSRPVALRDIRLVFAAPPDVACLLKARGLPVPYTFFAPTIGAVRAGLAQGWLPR